MSLNAGELLSNDEFVDPDCMARHMEEAMSELMGPSPDPDDTGKRGRRLFFIAISTGVIDYLKAHDIDAFRVSVNQGGTNLNGTLEIL
jgi:hypothetical protein